MHGDIFSRFKFQPKSVFCRERIRACYSCLIYFLFHRATFNSEERAETISGCIDCTAGYYCPVTAMSTPLVCGKGNYSASGASECTTCESGFYCDQNATSEVMMRERACPAGQFCEAGSITQPDLVSVIKYLFSFNSPISILLLIVFHFFHIF